MSKMKLLVSLPALLLTACATTGPEIRTVDTACQWTKPIYLNRNSVLVDDDAQQILSHNESGAKRCGWKRIKRKSP